MSAECYDWLIAASKRSHAIADLPDTIIDAVRKAKMDKRSKSPAKRKRKSRTG
jgi:hypothetical protein